MKLNFWGKTKELQKENNELKQKILEIKNQSDFLAIKNEIIRYSHIYKITFIEDRRNEMNRIDIYHSASSLDTIKKEVLMIEIDDFKTLKQIQLEFLNDRKIKWYLRDKDIEIINPTKVIKSKDIGKI